MATSPRKQQERRQHAALFLWLWVTLLSPVLHTWHHRADHVHGPTGVIEVAALLTEAVAAHLTSRGSHYPHLDEGDEQGFFRARHQHHGSEHKHTHHRHSRAHKHHHHTSELEHDHRRQEPHDANQDQDHRHGNGPHAPAPHGQGSADHFQLVLIHQSLVLLPLGLFTLLPGALAPHPIDTPDPRVESWIARSRGPPERPTT